MYYPIYYHPILVMNKIKKVFTEGGRVNYKNKLKNIV